MEKLASATAAQLLQALPDWKHDAQRPEHATLEPGEILAKDDVLATGTGRYHAKQRMALTS